MQEVFEKIIKKLEREKKSYEAEHAWNYAKGLEYAEEIVKQATAEYDKSNYFNLDEVTLHKCPVCGGVAEHRVNQRGSWACGCFKCKVFKFNYNHEKAIQAWEDFCTEYNNGWIPVEERLPENDNYILLSFENFSIPIVGRYEEDENGGAFYVGDEPETCVSQDLFVNAWQPLPEPYQPKGE